MGGAIFYGFTAIFEPIANELGWSYTQISLAASLRGLEMGILAPAVGVLTDRLGPRRMILGGAILTAAGLFVLGRAESLLTFYGAFVLIALGTSAGTMTVLMTAVASWFRARIGVASGIAICGFGLGGLMVPLIVGLIDAFDWRSTVNLMALGMLLVPLPLSLLFRHRPEQYGYLPDGNTTPWADPGAQASGAGAPAELNIGAGHALKSLTFWSLALAFSCQVLLVTAVVTHVMPYLSSVGIARSESSVLATAIPVASIAGRLGFGWLGDRFGRKLASSIGFGLMGLGVLCFGLVGPGGAWLMWASAALFGPGYGGINVMRPGLVQEYFGRRSFGTIFGLLMGLNMAGSVGGPALAGWAFDTWGTYQGAWIAMSFVPVAALFAVLSLKPVRSAELRH